MGRAKNIRIETDRQIARALVKPGTTTRRQLQARANLAGIQYRRLGERIIATKGYNSPTSPFEQKTHLSILDKEAFKAKFDTSRGLLIIEVKAPAAEFAEIGNTGPEGDIMRIRVKSSKVRKGKSKRGKPTYTLSSGTRVKRVGNKFYLFTDKVKPAKGYGLLRKAVRTAFRSL